MSDNFITDVMFMIQEQILDRGELLFRYRQDYLRIERMLRNEIPVNLTTNVLRRMQRIIAERYFSLTGFEIEDDLAGQL